MVDLDELWPPASALIGLLFEHEEQLRECLAVLDQDLGAYKVVNWNDPSMVVRKRDVPRLRDAGFTFSEVELRDPDTMSSDELYRLEWEMIHSEPVQRKMAEILRRPFPEP